MKITYGCQLDFGKKEKHFSTEELDGTTVGLGPDSAQIGAPKEVRRTSFLCYALSTAISRISLCSSIFIFMSYCRWWDIHSSLFEKSYSSHHQTCMRMESIWNFRSSPKFLCVAKVPGEGLGLDILMSEISMHCWRLRR